MKTQLLLVLLLFSLGQMRVAGQITQVFGWGGRINLPENDFPQKGFSPTGLLLDMNCQPLTNVASLSAGDFSCLVLRNDGVVVGWSGADFKIPANPSSNSIHLEQMNGLICIQGETLTNIQAVAAGTSAYMVLKRDGNVVSWESTTEKGDYKLVKPPGNLMGVKKISVGERRFLTLQSNGVVVVWGKGRLPPDGLTNIIEISAGRIRSSHDLALRNDGTVVEWSLLRNKSDGYTPPNLTNIVSIASGNRSCLALRRDGTVVQWPNRHDGTPVPPVTYQGTVLNDVKAIAAGDYFSVALRTNGQVVIWGDYVPERLKVPAGLSNVVAIAAGSGFCLALTTNSVK